MGKVRDEAQASKPAKAASRPVKTGRNAPSALGLYLRNLLQADAYKPTQGWYARLFTALGLGALVVAGIFALYQTQLADRFTPPVRFGVPMGLGAVLGWLLFRTVNFPPFAEFLIATEAEMKKVSWTTWPDLKRATAVVLVVVLVISFYLLGVDLIWQYLLQLVGVLRFSSSGFGSQAG